MPTQNMVIRLRHENDGHDDDDELTDIELEDNVCWELAGLLS